jgi:predicted O-methyltransferase YrrM
MLAMGSRPVHRHMQSWLTLEETRSDRRFKMPYNKTYDFEGAFIDAGHAALAHAPTHLGMIDIGIKGWLLPADACKLYELVYFCGGDCLEFGTFRGLSASVMLSASVAAGLDNVILSIDLDPGAKDAGRAALAGRPGAERVYFFNTDADEALGTFTRAARMFSFCFIDHSHSYVHVRSACEALPGVMLPGGFCLFHDFNDPRNADARNDDYGVWQGVQDGLDMRCFEFWGIYGCTGLFRRID